MSRSGNKSRATMLARERTGLVLPPWRTDSGLWRLGVVSLFDMLQYSAEDFYALSQELTSLGFLPAALRTPQGRERLQRCVTSLHEHARHLGLSLTINQIECVVEAANQGGNNLTAVSTAILELQKRVREELSARVFCCIEQEKLKYFDPFWLEDDPLFVSHDEVLREFHAAGRCYAYGENTACVFHLMRIVDYGMRMVGVSLGISYDARNWSGIASAIEAKMRQKYQEKTEAWKKSEPFYAEILTDIQAIGRGHRNPVLHELEKKYDEREALYMLTVVETLMRNITRELSATRTAGSHGKGRI